MMELKDENLYIKRILDGETELFAFFLNRYSRPLYSLIMQIVSSPEDTEELLQDVFLKAFQTLGHYRGSSSFSTWVYRIAYNRAISFMRRRKRPECVYIEECIINNVPDNEADQIMVLSDDKEQLFRLSNAIGRLNAEEKALITLFYYEEKPIEEIALILELTQVNAKVKLHRTRKKLYLLMKE